MATAQKVVGSAWRGIRSDLLVPDRSFLMSEHVFGDTLAKSVQNRADPSRPLTVLGNPTINPVGAVVRPGDQGYGFETQGYINSDDRTLIAVRKKHTQGAAQVGVIGQKNNDVPWGLRVFGANNFAGNGEASGAFDQGAKRPTPDPDIWFFEAAVAVPYGYGKLYYWQGGAQQVATSGTIADAPRVSAPSTQRVFPTAVGGPALTASSPTTIEIAYFIEFNRPLSAGEIATIYTNVVADGARRGIVIV